MLPGQRGNRDRKIKGTYAEQPCKLSSRSLLKSSPIIRCRSTRRVSVMAGSKVPISRMLQLLSKLAKKRTGFWGVWFSVAASVAASVLVMRLGFG
jgi:hypothetical protein